MSFDPFGRNPESLPPPALPGAGATRPAEPILPDVAEAMHRVKLPGLFLVAVGVLNLLVALCMTGFFVYLAVQPADKLYATQLDQIRQIRKQHPGAKMFADMEEEIRKKTPDELKNQGVISYGGIAVVLLATTLVVILGGVRMLQLRSYGFCVLASVVAAAPFLSPSCCCGVGGIVGVWSILVLLAPTVRMAFR